jgi:hypothetical protein
MSSSIQFRLPIVFLGDDHSFLKLRAENHLNIVIEAVVQSIGKYTVSFHLEIFHRFFTSNFFTSFSDDSGHHPESTDPGLHLRCRETPRRIIGYS